jgi:hypothetical protein
MQCQGITKIGTQCSRNITTGNYCWQHQTNKVTSPRIISSKVTSPRIISSKVTSPRIISSKVTSPRKITENNSDILKKFPSSEYNIIDTAYHKKYGKIYLIRSKCGLACDDFGSWYDYKGNFLRSNGSMIPISRLSKKDIEEDNEWRKNIK